MNASPAFVSEADLEDATGLKGYAIRWYIFELRLAGFVVEAAASADRVAFAQGARGWRMVEATGTSAVAPVCEPVEPVKGMRVESLTHGPGRVAFAREGFPSVVVEYTNGVREKTNREAFVRVETGVVYSISD